jgi:hypothetical protein
MHENWTLQNYAEESLASKNCKTTKRDFSIGILQQAMWVPLWTRVLLAYIHTSVSWTCIHMLIFLEPKHNAFVFSFRPAPHLRIEILAQSWILFFYTKMLGWVILYSFGHFFPTWHILRQYCSHILCAQMNAFLMRLVLLNSIQLTSSVPLLISKALSEAYMVFFYAWGCG